MQLTARGAKRQLIATTIPKQLIIAGTLLLISAFSSSAFAQCPSRYNPVRTNGLRYMINVTGAFGLFWGKDKEKNINVGSFTGGLQVDARGFIGMLTLGVAGDFQFGSKKRHYQIVDTHIGIDFKSVGLARYNYVLSHLRVRGYGWQYSRTRYCPQTQGTARHHSLTTGAKFAFTQRGKGVGSHLTYRFTQVWTRSNMGMYTEVQFNYANLNTFSNGTGFSTTKKGSENAYGGKVSLMYMWNYTSSGMSLGYFAGAWSFIMNFGVSFWGA